MIPRSFDWFGSIDSTIIFETQSFTNFIQYARAFYDGYQS